MTECEHFLNKLSPELRVTIYGFVFDSTTYVKRIPSGTSTAARPAIEDDRTFLFEQPGELQPKLVDTAICATNNLITAEALETFYNGKTVRLNCDKLLQDRFADYQSPLRMVEIIDCIHYSTPGTIRHASSSPRTCQGSRL